MTEAESNSSKAKHESEEPGVGVAGARSLSRSSSYPLLTIAIAKGRMQEAALDLLARAGVRASGNGRMSRRLTAEDETGRYRFIFVKPADVPVYVEHGIADCGIVGQDVLLEREGDVLLPLDLRIARCQIVVAAERADLLTDDRGVLRVATKYPEIARKHFGSSGIPVEIISLSGSVELAPVLGLANCIVDLMETGRTLQENGLKVVEIVADSSGRLVVNRASYQLKAESISALISTLDLIVNGSEKD
ncbi:MAG: ATP phosphoribosyltransferase [bacterium]